MTKPSAPVEQLALLKSQLRTRRAKPLPGPAPQLPVARVAVDLALAHLDRAFDYVVPETMHEKAVPGCRVKVRFSGRDVDGYLLARVSGSTHPGRLASLRRVVSAEPVLHESVLAVSRLVADRYAGTVADVLRLAVPPRHARVEGEQPPVCRAQPFDMSDQRLAASWAAEVGGQALLDRLATGGSPRAVWTATPGAVWPAQLAAVAAATLRSGRGSLLCLPDARDVARVDQALADLLGGGAHVALTAGLGPAARYRAFLAASRGQVQIVVGTRAAALAPVRDLGLVAMWDDGDDLFDEPRAPYPNAREVLLLRAHHEQTAALFGGHSRSVECAALLEAGWAVSLQAPANYRRAVSPRVHITGESERELERDAAIGATRMPRRVFEVVREALHIGPVLVHVPRYGYQPALACANCRRPARCFHCSGTLGRSDIERALACRWCAVPADAWSCPHCHGRQLRAPIVGSLRTAQEWGHSFPQTPVLSSGGDHVLDNIGPQAAIVVATPGAEPMVTVSSDRGTKAAAPWPRGEAEDARPGFAAAIILDTWLTLGRPTLDATEEALRRWLNIAALVRPASSGGRVVAVGEPSLPVLQALVRVDPSGFAARELAERASARLAPTVRLASITAPGAVVAEVMAALDLPAETEVLGPVDLSSDVARVVIRSSRDRGAALTRALKQVQAARSSRKLSPIRVQVDPAELI
ncbi:MAG: primosomal protein N' [Nocardioidaceae bacterium]